MRKNPVKKTDSISVWFAAFYRKEYIALYLCKPGDKDWNEKYSCFGSYDDVFCRAKLSMLKILPRYGTKDLIKYRLTICRQG